MEIVNIEARTFEAMLSKFKVFADRMEKLCTLYGDMSQRTCLAETKSKRGWNICG